VPLTNQGAELLNIKAREVMTHGVITFDVSSNPGGCDHRNDSQPNTLGVGG